MIIKTFIASVAAVMFCSFTVMGSQVWAHDQFLLGQVYLTVDGRALTEPLSDVIVYREDDYPNRNGRGVISVTLSQDQDFGGEAGLLGPGGYGFVYNQPIGGGLTACGEDGHCCGNKNCPVITIGQSVADARCAEHYHCSLSCSEENLPQRFLAYFPKNYDSSRLPPGVGFIAGDMKGGGSWLFHLPANVDRLVAPNKTWGFNAANFGQVTYNPGEWVEAITTVNEGGRSNINIEWLPSGNYSCTNLAVDKEEGEIVIGDKPSFSCQSSISDGSINFSKYNYRLKTPGSDDWSYPDGWDDLSGSTPEYEITEAGNYQVQCQVCVTVQGNQICTDWGEAN